MPDGNVHVIVWIVGKDIPLTCRKRKLCIMFGIYLPVWRKMRVNVWCKIEGSKKKPRNETAMNGRWGPPDLPHVYDPFWYIHVCIALMFMISTPQTGRSGKRKQETRWFVGLLKRKDGFSYTIRGYQIPIFHNLSQNQIQTLTFTSICSRMDATQFGFRSGESDCAIGSASQEKLPRRSVATSTSMGWKRYLQFLGWSVQALHQDSLCGTVDLFLACGTLHAAILFVLLFGPLWLRVSNVHFERRSGIAGRYFATQAQMACIEKRYFQSRVSDLVSLGQYFYIRAASSHFKFCSTKFQTLDLPPWWN